jgi:CRISPR-associated protein Cmr6
LDYYGSEGAKPATDLDSPIPNAQIAVRGAFRFVLEGPAAWLPLGAEMLTAALTEVGIGAKTRTGYGVFRAPSPEAPEGGGDEIERCAWVDDTIAAFKKQHNAQEKDTLRGKPLAEAWQTITDPEIKTQALADIRARWHAAGWWDNPPSKKAQQAKEIYLAT